MALTREDILHIADLARLNIPEEKVDYYVRNASKILGYIEQLNKLDTSRAEPTSHAVEVAGFDRADEVKHAHDPAAITENAPARDGSLYSVPKVL